MKTITSILLLFIILVQTFSPFVYDAAYSFNKKYITEKFCINKEKPSAHCEGHCYLNKQKAKEQGADKQSNESKRDKIEFSAYELPGEIIAVLNVATINIRYNQSVNIFLHDYTSSIFRPPLV